MKPTDIRQTTVDGRTDDGANDGTEGQSIDDNDRADDGTDGLPEKKF